MTKCGYILIAFIPWILTPLQAFAQIEINNFGAGLSYWHRNYSGVDERSFLIDDQKGTPFKPGALMPTVSAELRIIGEMAVDGRIGLWSNTVVSEGTSLEGALIREQIDQRIVPVSLGAVYTFRHIIPDIFNAYAGVGGSRYYIRNSMERIVYNAGGSLPTQVFKGNNLGFYGKVGLEYMIAPQIGLVIEGRYHTGSYNQVRITPPNTLLEPVKVSLQGIEAALGLRYSLFPMYGRRHVRY